MNLSFKRIFIFALWLFLLSTPILVIAGEPVVTLKNSSKLEHPVYGVALAPTGKLLAVGSCAVRVNRETVPAGSASKG